VGQPEITALEDCRYQVAVEAERFTARGEVGRFRFPPMVVAEVEIHVQLPIRRH
jgi:AraC family transcriptional regulator